MCPGQANAKEKQGAMGIPTRRDQQNLWDEPHIDENSSVWM
jgi:hypothetical protein